MNLYDTFDDVTEEQLHDYYDTLEGLGLSEDLSGDDMLAMLDYD